MNSVYLFTGHYPYSFQECFLEDEITYLAEGFDNIHIIPSVGAKDCRIVPENCIIHSPLDLAKNKLMYLLRGVFSFRTIRLFFSEFFGNKVYLSRLRLNSLITATLHLNNLIHCKRLKTILDSTDENDVLYFFWGTDFIKIALFYKGKSKMVSRFHGYWDLWEESYGGFMPYRKFVVKRLAKCAFISKYGKKYFENKYPLSLTSYNPLGSKDFGNGPCKSDDNVLRVVSCSDVYPLKRVSLLFEALNSAVDLEIEWTHIGDGTHFNELKSMVQNQRKKHLTVNLLGALEHNRVMEYYKDHQFDVFVNLSTNEGVPVSIMEAISFNIPVVATNVGGTSDVVPEDVGELLLPNPTKEDIVRSIKSVVSKDLCPRKFWMSHFNADVNYSDMVMLLKSL